MCCWPPGQDGVNPLRVEIAEGRQLWPSLRVSVLQVGKSGKARMGRAKVRMDQQAWHLGARMWFLTGGAWAGAEN